jgi:hypothetical protein
MIELSASSILNDVCASNCIILHIAKHCWYGVIKNVNESVSLCFSIGYYLQFTVNTILSVVNFSILWNRVISHFCGTGSFHNLVEQGHFSFLWNRVFLISMEQGHFSFLWNRVISQFCGTGSFLNLVGLSLGVDHRVDHRVDHKVWPMKSEQGYFSFLWNRVISHFCGTGSFLNLLGLSVGVDRRGWP